jgi:hypothetical protein
MPSLTAILRENLVNGAGGSSGATLDKKFRGSLGTVRQLFQQISTVQVMKRRAKDGIV